MRTVCWDRFCGMEGAFAETEAAAGVAVKAASRVLSQARAMVKAAQTGNIVAI